VSVQEALLFLRDARDDAALRALMRNHRPVLDLPALVALAAERGRSFSADDLRSAFALDWKLRTARRSGAAAAAAPPEPGRLSR